MEAAGSEDRYQLSRGGTAGTALRYLEAPKREKAGILMIYSQVEDGLELAATARRPVQPLEGQVLARLYQMSGG